MFEPFGQPLTASKGVMHPASSSIKLITNSQENLSNNGIVHPPTSVDPIIALEIETSLEKEADSHSMAALDVSYWSMEGFFSRKKKMILQNVTCVYKKGVNIILGPSGAGKTTFLDLLAARKDPSQSSGTVLMNGKQRPRGFKNKVGYVTQDDVMMGTLTVRECISFSAALRLPSSFGSDNRKSRVEEIITELGLEKCANTKIGHDYIRGISGGERKRCNIGTEMVISPQILFLDEPTTGLDATTAHSVMRLLKRMSETGRVIILSIHQPRYSIYQMADTTTMLCGGRLIYNGPPAEVLDFLSSQGFVCDQFNNPADFILDTVSSHAYDSDGQSLADRFVDAFRTSQWQADIEKDIKELLTMATVSDTVVRSSHVFSGERYATNWFRQFAVISCRGLKDVITNPQITAAMLVKAVILAIFVGMLFYQLADDVPRATQDRTGVLFFLQLAQQFVNLSAVNVFIAERKLFVHEISNGYYRTSAYFMSKVVNDLIPLRLFPVIVLSAISYFTVGLRPGMDHFVLLFFALYAVCMTAACMCFLVGCSVTKEETGHIIMSMIVALSNLYAGFIINFDSMPAALAWIKHLSVAKYGFGVLMANEFTDRIFYLSGTNQSISGNDYLEQLEIPIGVTFKDVLPCFLALGAISWASLILGYIQLRRMKVHS